ncbi:MAG TPA: OmpH family outer membrane protein [Veillonellaceae bacterium]|nr:OmpH family outer membrane protein [Veillonellaceae bacterium]
MKKFKRLLLAGALMSGFICVPGMSDAANGYVNYPAVLQAAPQLVEAQREIVETQNSLQKEFNEKSQKMTDADKRALADRLNKQLQRKQQNIEKNKIVPTINKIRSAIAAAAKENNIDFVVQEGAWLYGGKDLTPEVIARVKAK